MTMTHQRRKGRALTSNPAQGVRIERQGGSRRSVRRTEAGRIALPLWVLNNGRHVGDGALVMTQDDARELFRELCEQLGVTPPVDEPEAETT